MNKTAEMIRMEADMAASEELRGKLEAAMKRIAEAGEAKSDGEIFEKAAAELGYHITAAELERLSAENEAVSPDELDQAAGGVVYYPSKPSKGDDNRKEDSDGHAVFCMAAWHCYTAMIHTKANQGNERVRCWKDYNCIMVNK